MLVGAAMSVGTESVIGLLWIIIIITINCSLTHSVDTPVGANLQNTQKTENSVESETEPEHEDFSEDALERLSNLFGISRIPKNFHHRTPPDYMVDLYSTVAYADGITKQSVPYDADVVRAIPDKGKLLIFFH